MWTGWPDDAGDVLTRSYFEETMNLQSIRICLGTDGTAIYWPLYEGEEDLGSMPLDPEDALHAITGGSVPFEIACNDPKDDSVHNYETLIDQLQKI